MSDEKTAAPGAPVDGTEDCPRADRLKMLAEICRRTGLERVDPSGDYLTRRELLHLLAWVSVKSAEGQK
jgi:hypothetical protein